MATIALVVAVLLNAALAVVVSHFLRRSNARIARLESAAPYRYLTPEDPEVFKISFDPEPSTTSSVVDVAGAWAAEQEAMGRPVTDEEIAIQRRLWAAECG